MVQALSLNDAPFLVGHSGKMHRVVMPDGSMMEFPEIKKDQDADTLASGATTNSGPLSTRTTSDLDVNVTSQSESVNINATKIIKNVEEKGALSVSVPVSANDKLVAIHNIHADDLMKSIELGGFPSPSIAVIRASMRHTEFGDISLNDAPFLVGHSGKKMEDTKKVKTITI